RSRRSSSARNTGSAHAARNSASSCWHAGTSVSGTNSPPNSPKRPSGPGSPITGAVVVSLMVGSRSGGGRPAGRRGRVGRSQPLVEHPVEGAVVGVAPGRARWRLGGPGGLDERPDLAGVLAPRRRLDAGGHVDAPRAHDAHRVTDVLRRQAAGQ